MSSSKILESQCMTSYECCIIQWNGVISMESKLKFTRIKYVPLNGNGEAINIAVVLHDYTRGELYFDKIRKHKRLSSFDDELDLSEFKETLSGIEEYMKKPFTNNLFHRAKGRYDEHDLADISSMFLNEYRMSEIQPVYTSNIKDSFNHLRDTFLYYDIDRKKRPNKNEAIQSINELFTSAQREWNLESLTKDYRLDVGLTHGEPITFDYKIGDNYYKIIDLEAKRYALKYVSAKAWVYNASYLKNNEKLKFIIVNDQETDETKAMIKILNSRDGQIEVIDSSRFMEDINKEQRRHQKEYLQ